MKKIFLLGFCFFFIFGCRSCKEEIKPILSYCGGNFILNEDKTKCICPPETHMMTYLLGEEDTDPLSGKVAGRECRPRAKYLYYVQFEGNNCIWGLRNDFLELSPVGFWRFDKANNGHENDFYIDIKYNEGSESTFIGQQPPPNEDTGTGITIEERDDGKIEVNLATNVMHVNSCHDWADKTERKAVRGYGHGVSNAENTKIDIEVLYKDPDGMVLDTAYIHLWK